MFLVSKLKIVMKYENKKNEQNKVTGMIKTFLYDIKIKCKFQVVIVLK